MNTFVMMTLLFLLNCKRDVKTGTVQLDSSIVQGFCIENATVLKTNKDKEELLKKLKLKNR